MNRNFALLLALGIIAALVLAGLQVHGLRRAVAAAESANQDMANQIDELRATLADLRAAPQIGVPSVDPFAVQALRDEISSLALQVAALAERPSSPATNTALQLVYPDSVRRSDYRHAGFADPHAAVESQLWAITQLNAEAFLESQAPGPERDNWVRILSEMPDGRMPGGFKNGAMYRAAGYRIVEDTPVSDDERHLKVFLEGQDIFIRPIIKKVDGQWKWAGQKMGD